MRLEPSVIVTGETAVEGVSALRGRWIGNMCPLVVGPMGRFSSVGAWLALGDLYHKCQRFLYPWHGGRVDPRTFAAGASALVSACGHRLLRRLHDFFDIRVGDVSADPRRQLVVRLG